MKKFSLFSFLLLLSAVFNLSLAGSPWGAEITYKHATGDSFDVTLKVYRDCAGLPLGNQVLKVKSACKATNYTMVLASSRDVTGIPAHCPQQSRCSGTYQYGFMEEIFTGRVRMGGDSCCKYNLSWTFCCRNAAITTGAANTNLYIETWVDICLAPANSSPKFTKTPLFLIPSSQDAHLNNFAVDSINNDSISFTAVDPAMDSGVLISWSGPWNASKPFTFLGFPNVSLNFPAGFHFDATTGLMSFRPTVTNQMSVYAVKVSEWRKINGVWTLIGETTRELTGLILTSPNNKPPVFTTVNPNGGLVKGNISSGEIPICNTPGTYCTEIVVNDIDSTNDTLYFNYKHNLNNITFNNIGTLKQPVIKVCYTPDAAELASGKPLTFVMEVLDNNCPFPGTAEKTFTFKPKNILPDSFAFSKQLSCANLVLVSDSSSGIKVDYSWEIESPHGIIDQSIVNPFVFNLSDSGWSTIRLSVQKADYCNVRTYTDSVFLPTANNLKVKVTPDTVVCFNPNITLGSIITNGKAPYTYAWSTGSTAPSTAVVLQSGVNIYTLEITDSSGCKATDEVKAEFYNPQATLSGDSTVCAGKPVTITANITAAIKPVISWAGFTNSTNTLVDVPAASRQYQFSLTDSAGCKVNETWNVTVHAPDLQFTHSSSFCANDSVRLSATGSNSTGPYSFVWSPSGKIGSSIVLPPAGTPGAFNFNATVTDAFGCTKTKNSSVTIAALPAVSVSAIGPYCETASAINLSGFGTPSGGTWSGTAVAGNAFNPSTAGPGNYQLTYSYTSSASGCSNSANATVMVQQKPVADFAATKTIGVLGETFSFINTSTGPQTGYEWNFGDPGSGSSNTAFSTNAAHIFSDTGLFTITLTTTGNGVCAADVKTRTGYIRVTMPTGMKDIIKNGLKIYPNPATNRVTIEADKEITLVEIYDVAGRLVEKQGIYHSSQATVSLHNLDAGNYIIKTVLVNGETITAPLVITQ